MRCLSIALFAVVASSLLAPAAMAEAEGAVAVMGIAPDGRGGYITRKAMVDLSDLDVKKVENAPAILSRLQTAAEAVCRTRQAADREFAKKLQKCRTQAMADIVGKLDAPELTRLAREP